MLLEIDIGLNALSFTVLLEDGFKFIINYDGKEFAYRLIHDYLGVSLRLSLKLPFQD